jgi:hypothetical protein
MLRTYLQRIGKTALQCSWRATNGLAGAALAGVFLIRPGVIAFVQETKWGAQPANWLLSFILYAMIAWTILFFIQLIFFAPYLLYKRDQQWKSEDSARAETNRQALIVKHDKELASRLREIFPEGEKQVLRSNLLNQHAYWDTQSGKLMQAVLFVESAEAHFLEKEVQKRAKDFAEASGSLLHFMAYKFFVYPQDQRTSPIRFVMQPNLNADRDGDGSVEQDRKYDALTEQLEAHVEQMSDAYDTLIKAFHAQLLD